MIATVLIWIYITALVYPYGVLADRLLAGVFGVKREQSLFFSIQGILGLLFITTLLGYLNAVVNIGVAVHVLLVAGAVVVYILFRRSISMSIKVQIERIQTITWSVRGVFILSFLFILIKSTQGTDHIYDIALYHAQSIRWMQSYPIIPGLGNVNMRFIFNTFWFLPQAFFGLVFLKIQSFHVLNGYFMLLCTMFLLGSTPLMDPKNRSVYATMSGLIMILVLFIFRKALSSTYYDLPVTLLIVVILMLAFKKALNKTLFAPDMESVLIIVFSTSALTIKLTAAPIVLLPMLLIAKELIQRRWNLFIVSAITGIVIVAPWFYRNIMVSGYLFYSFPALDILNVNWKVPEQYIKLLFNKSTFKVVKPYKHVLDQGVWVWGPIWFKHLSSIRKLIVLTIVVFHGAYAMYAIRYPQRAFRFLREHSQTLWIFGMTWLGIIFMIKTVPDMRYHFHFLLFMMVLLVAPSITYVFNTKLLRRWGYDVLIYGVLLCMLIVFVSYRTIGARLLLPVDYQPVNVRYRNVGSVRIAYPEKGERCGNTPIPCSPCKPEGFELRGDTIRQGFKAKNK